MIEIAEIREKQLEQIQKDIQAELLRQMDVLDADEKKRKDNIAMMEKIKVDQEKKLPEILLDIEKHILIDVANKSKKTEIYMNTDTAGLVKLNMLVSVLSLHGYVCSLQLHENYFYLCIDW